MPVEDYWGTEQVDLDVEEAVEVDLNGQVIASGTGRYIERTIVDAKGDLIVGTGDGAVDNLPAGVEGSALVVDSDSPTGLGWAVPASAEHDHDEYALDTDLTAHEAAGDPHPQYLTAAEVDLSAHENAPDPHPGYLTQAEGDTLYPPKSGPFAPTITGATGVTRYVGGTATGAPTTGTFAVGDFVIARDGAIWICTTAGTPGTWVFHGAASSANPVALGTAAPGTSGTVSRRDHVHPMPSATDVAAIAASLVDAKGDLIVATADNTPARLAVGANNRLLQADSAATPGVKWGLAVTQQTSAPSSPATGDLWVDTDEAASGGPSSILGYAEVVADQGGITSEVDLAGLSVTVTVPAGRRLRITGHGMIKNTVADAFQVFRLHMNGVQIQSRTLAKGAANADVEAFLAAVVNPSAGTHTFKLRAWAISGTSTFVAASTNPAFILVEDITGSLWPAGQSIGAGTIASEAWTAFVPTVRFNGPGGTVASIVSDCYYQRVGRKITAHYMVRFTNLNGGSGYMDVTLPVTMKTMGPGAQYFMPIGTGSLVDLSSGNAYFHFASVNLTSSMVLRSAASPQVTAGSATPFPIAVGGSGVGDEFWATITYEAAS